MRRERHSPGPAENPQKIMVDHRNARQMFKTKKAPGKYRIFSPLIVGVVLYHGKTYRDSRMGNEGETQPIECAGYQGSLKGSGRETLLSSQGRVHKVALSHRVHENRA